jgi:tetratricopeptide (TPR) repeat protein
MTAYEYRLREARYLTLTDRPERFKDNIENILRFAEQQQKRELNNAEKRRLNTLIAGAYNCRAAYYHNFHRKQHQAIQLYKAAYSLLANSDSEHNMPKVCANLADAYIQDNNMPMAAQWYRRALFLVDSLALPRRRTSRSTWDWRRYTSRCTTSTPHYIIIKLQRSIST